MQEFLQAARVVEVACMAATGEVSDVTTGSAIASPPTTASFRINSRRDGPTASSGTFMPLSSSLALPSLSRASRTISSSRGSSNSSSRMVAISDRVVRPSQCRQTTVAERFRQWAL